ncbi:MAG: sodium:proton antiporter [Lachnospiraceae bacterium]|nr:sodium:proton antiporter [Lachnospiraceae bacterium]
MMNDLLSRFCIFGLSFQSDGMRILYFLITTFVVICCSLFCKEYLAGEHKNKRFWKYWIITYLAVVGFLFSADFFTLFMFFEIMSFASTVWVLQEENEESDYAGRLYLRISVICGMVLLFGFFMVAAATGEFGFAKIAEKISGGVLSEGQIFAAAVLILVGFGAKAGVFLVHVWLPKAHTAAPAPASAVLSGILTKTGIVGIIITTCILGLMGNENWGTLLMVLGGCTMFVGAFLAIFSTNLKRTLACSSVSQIGFIVTGISCMVLLENGFAYTGTLLHMFNHSMIKLVLFLIAGGVLKKTGSLDLNKIKGFGRNKPFLMVPFAIGALSIAGVPGFSGYVSKTLIHEAVEAVHGIEAAHIVGIVFTITGGMTLCYMTKLFVCLFIDKGEASEKPGLSKLSYAAVCVPAAVLFVLGILPKVFAKIPSVAVLKEFAAAIPELEFEEVEEMHWFAFHTMEGGLISISIGIALYFLFVRTLLIRKGEYKQGLPFWFDLEKYIYRPVILYFLPFVMAFFSRIFDKFTDFIAYALKTRVLTPLKPKQKAVEGNAVTEFFGKLFDLITFRNWRKDGGERKSFVHRFATANEGMNALGRVIERSLSLSLLLFSTGLLITLIYMLCK